MAEEHYTFPRSRRITSPEQFRAVYDIGVSVNVGPLRVHGLPNDVGYPRLGLAVSRRVGNSVVRNRNKRMLREAFRLAQHELPTELAAYDLVVSVRPHKPLLLDDYRRLLLDAAKRLEGIWKKRQSKPAPPHNPAE